MSLTDSLMELVGSEAVLSKIGPMIGLGGDDAASAMGASVPALLSSLADRAEEPGGAETIGRMVDDQDDGILNDIGGFLSNRSSDGDESMMASIFGGGRGAASMISGLAGNLGVGAGSITKLLPAVAPMVLGFLKRKVSSDGLDAGGLAGLLSTEKAGLASSGKLGALGLGGLGAAGISKMTGDAKGAAGAATGKLTGGARDIGGTAAGGAARVSGGAKGVAAGGAAIAGGAQAAGGGWRKWIGPLLGLLALLIIVPLLITQCGGDDDAEPATTTAAVAAPTEAPAPDSTDAPAPAGDLNADLRSALDGAGFGAVTGSIDGDVATLTGAVDSEDARGAAEAAALAVDGINAVDNQLTVEGDSLGTIVDIASANADFSTLVGAVTAAGLGDALSGDGPFTVFAPTNDAFAALDAVPEGDALANVLTYHVVEGEVFSGDLETGTVTTLQGQELDIVVGDDGAVTVNGVNVVSADIAADNGVIHVVDGVLLPPAAAPVAGDVLEIENITFEVGSAVITAEGRAVLDEKAVPFMTDNADVRVEIGGHTDSDGSASGNQALSQARAESVRQYLVDNGIAVDRMDAIGYGEESPIAGNDTPENKAINRRIEFKVL